MLVVARVCHPLLVIRIVDMSEGQLPLREAVGVFKHRLALEKDRELCQRDSKAFTQEAVQGFN